jgi:hypothetical protein
MAKAGEITMKKVDPRTEQESDFPTKLAAPARRALAGAGYHSGSNNTLRTARPS